VTKREVRVLCWSSPRGKKPVRDWIARLDDAAFRKVDKMIGLVRVLGHEIRPPHGRSLGEGLYELRDVSTGPGYRIYYCWQDDLLVILLAAGDKGSQDRDIETARRRMRDEE
jgi:putative addiction module killer protein